MNRRSLLIGGALVAPAVLLSSCGIVSSTSTGGVSTVTVNVAKLNAYALAVQNGADALLANPLIANAIGIPTAIVIAAALSSASAAINAIDSAAKGSQTLTFNTNSPPAVLASLQTDAVTVFDAFKTGMGAAALKLPANVLSAYDALQTIVALLLALLPTVGAAERSNLPTVKMSETKALALLHAN